MGDPDCCPRCGTFWRYHDEVVCADGVHTENVRLRAERDIVHAYLSRLLISHAPQCEPLPDLVGVVTQIDNLLTGMRRRT